MTENLVRRNDFEMAGRFWITHKLIRSFEKSGCMVFSVDSLGSWSPGVYTMYEIVAGSFGNQVSWFFPAGIRSLGTPARTDSELFLPRSFLFDCRECQRALSPPTDAPRTPLVHES